MNNPTVDRFIQILGKRVGDLHNQIAENVCNGVPVADYREQVGYLRGLRDALKKIEEARAELFQG